MNPTRTRCLICASATALALFLSCTAFSDEKKAIRDLPATEVARELKENEKIVVLDIRTPEEYAAGHLAGARNIDFKAADFESKIAKLDKSKTYVVHCRSGRRSGLSMKKFRELKFQSVLHMKDGIQGWEAAGLKTEK